MRYRIFGNTGLRLSTLALGTGNFGNGWGYGADKDEARNIYTRYREAGGNFIDTADQYQFGQSETMLSDFMATDRDDIVLATKFSLGDSPEAGLQRSGNSRKSMINSLEASLKRLKTDHIDLLWVHMPDGVTPVDQIARALDDLIRSGKILYAGMSDFPAWRVATAATFAELHGWSSVSAVQLEYSLVEHLSIDLPGCSQNPFQRRPGVYRARVSVLTTAYNLECLAGIPGNMYQVHHFKFFVRNTMQPTYQPLNCDLHNYKY